MKRQTIIELLMFVALVSIGAAVRVSLRDLPNFAPVGALALFAGYFFRSRVVALSAPLLVMTISDSIIGGYVWWVMLTVYAMLAMPVLMRSLLRRLFRLEGAGWKRTIASFVGLTACSLGASVSFFLVTNFPAWLAFNTYDPTLAGLMTCYYQALPFFRYTLIGDLVFSFVLFGGYILALHTIWAEASETAPAEISVSAA